MDASNGFNHKLAKLKDIRIKSLNESLENPPLNGSTRMIDLQMQHMSNEERRRLDALEDQWMRNRGVNKLNLYFQVS